MTLNDTLTCVDENECLTPSSCSQVCVDTKGSYKCECAAGYQLMPNQRTCKLASKPITVCRVYFAGHCDRILFPLPSLDAQFTIYVDVLHARRLLLHAQWLLSYTRGGCCYTRVDCAVTRTVIAVLQMTR